MDLITTDRKKLVTTFIELRKPLFIITVLWGGSFAILLAADSAKADMLCDCTQVVDSCSATVSLDGMTVNIESDNDACSRVDYLVEGQPFAALVVGGSSATQWPGQPLSEPVVVVENCRVCANTADVVTNAVSQTDSEANAAADDTTRAIAKVMPSYPRDAWAIRAERVVTVEVDVSENSSVYPCH